MKQTGAHCSNAVTTQKWFSMNYWMKWDVAAAATVCCTCPRPLCRPAQECAFSSSTYARALPADRCPDSMWHWPWSTRPMILAVMVTRETTHGDERSRSDSELFRLVDWSDCCWKYCCWCDCSVHSFERAWDWDFWPQTLECWNGEIVLENQLLVYEIYNYYLLWVEATKIIIYYWFLLFNGNKK